MLTYRSASMCGLGCLIECTTYDNEFTFTKIINTWKTVFGVQNVNVSDTLRCIHVHGPVWGKGLRGGGVGLESGESSRERCLEF